jgi:hypothetical protein
MRINILDPISADSEMSKSHTSGFGLFDNLTPNVNNPTEFFNIKALKQSSVRLDQMVTL